jgi:hypothetical protein
VGVGMLGRLGSQLSLAEGNGNCLWAGVTSSVGFQRKNWMGLEPTYRHRDSESLHFNF